MQDSTPTLSMRDAIRQIRESMHAKIADTITNCPYLTYWAIAKLHNCSEFTVYNVAKEFGIRRTYRGEGTC